MDLPSPFQALTEALEDVLGATNRLRRRLRICWRRKVVPAMVEAKPEENRPLW